MARERVYLAGFGATGRRALGVHDPLYARVLLLSEGGKSAVVVGFDWLGLYRNDVLDLRSRTGFDAPDRFLFAAATHEHSGPDTLGLWGPALGVSGVNKAYHERAKAKVAAAIRRLYSELEDVSLTGSDRAIDPRGLCRDSRDPVVIDPYLRTLRLTSKKDGKALATVVDWSCHPEAVGRGNRLVSADYPGPLCERVESRAGGVCVFLSGAIGGLMTPDMDERRGDYYESARIGQALADRALEELARPDASAAAPALSFSVKRLLVPIENPRYLLFLPALTFGHRLLSSDGRPLARWKEYWLPMKRLLGPLAPEQRPWVETEVSVLRIGPALLLGLPGELFPELELGGYDGRYAFGHPLIGADNPNPPDLARAPKGPYLRDLMRSPLKFVVGLADDELGYIVPGYDFKARAGPTMLPRLPGHHYEETNSIGPSATDLILAAARELLAQPQQVARAARP